MILTPKNWGEFQHYKDRSPSWIKLHKALLDDFEFASLPVESRALAPMLWLLASENDSGAIDATLDKLGFRLHMTAKEVAEALHPLIEAGFFIEGGTPEERQKWPSRYVSDKLRAQVLERDGGRCVSCGDTENLEIDHKTPVSKGGKSELDNLQALCRPCNRSKRVKTSEQFATQTKKLRSLEKEEENIEKKEEKEKETREVALSSDDPFDFIKFWTAWPNRVGKPAAQKAFKSARRRASLEEILAGVESYIRDKPPDRPWLNPATFLNQNRWEDRPAAVGTQNAKPRSQIIQAADDLRRKIASFDGPARGEDDARGREGAASPRLLSNG